MPDLDVVGTVNTVIYRAPIDDPRYDRATRFCFVRNDEVYAAIGSINGRDLWGTHIMDYPGKPDDPARLSHERTVELLHAAIGDDTVPIEILAANPWEARLGMASRFRRGRAFLAGDAAHVQTSAGGLGMNTGIQDGHNLAWKLAAVLHGQAAPSLLDTYEAERRAAAALSVGYSRTMTRSVGIGPAGGGTPGIMHEDHHAAALRAMMFYGYRSPAIVPEDQAEPETEPDVLDDDARPGYRLPHHWLVAGDDRVSTVDIAGSGWLLLTGPKGHPWLSAAASLRMSLGIEVRAHRITDDALADPDGTFCDVSGIAPDGAVLVRPDGFVAWRTATLGGAGRPREALRDAVSRILGRGSTA